MLHPSQLDLRLGYGSYVPDEVDVTHDDVEGGYGVEQRDMQAWKNERNEWAQSMRMHGNDVYG
jgi:hypothetical protein